MTLCVAAICQDNGKDRVVIATDWKVSTVSATAEIQDKLYWITPEIPVLIAGTISRAVELKDTYKQYFESLSKKTPPVAITQSNVADVLKRPLALYKRKLTQEYISMRFGLDYKEFREATATKGIPQAVASDAYAEISRLDLDCDLIIVMFDKDKEAYIYRTDAEGMLHHCENFAAIGSGQTIAEGVLYQREHEARHPLGVTVYRVFEAMKLGSIASDVGKKHTLNVLHPPDREHKELWADGLTPTAERFLARSFRKLGPKNFKRLSLPHGSFEEDF